MTNSRRQGGLILSCALKVETQKHWKGAGTMCRFSDRLDKERKEGLPFLADRGTDAGLDLPLLITIRLSETPERQCSGVGQQAAQDYGP